MYPELLHYLRESLKFSKDVFTTKSARYVASRVLRSILKDEAMRGIVICIDALDECADDLDDLLDFIHDSDAAHGIRWVMTSRSDAPKINQTLSQAPQCVITSFEDSDTCIYKGVRLYINTRLKALAEAWQNPVDGAELETVTTMMATRSENAILWAKFAIRQLHGLQLKGAVIGKIEAMPPGLDSFYREAMDNIQHSSNKESLKRILGICLVAWRPLTLDELFGFLEPSVEDHKSLKRQIELYCRTMLKIHLTTRTVEFVRSSGREFLEKIGRQDLVNSHQIVFRLIITRLRKCLRRDMWNLQHPGAPKAARQPNAGDPLAHAHYACVFWTRHLDSIPPQSLQPRDLEMIEEEVILFLKHHFLHWLESLSLLDILPGAGPSLERLQMFSVSLQISCGSFHYDSPY